MCTVVIRVPQIGEEPVRLLAVRDEDPDRGWMPLGENWPDHPGVVGVRDRRAGGAWLAADPGSRRLAVLLNRRSPEPPEGVELISRGGIPLDAIAGLPIEPTVVTAGFNLVTVDASRGSVAASVITWDGVERRETRIPPGTHMIAHEDLDDLATARIAAWRNAFSEAPTDGPDWFVPWLEVLRASAVVDPDDERAIVRDNRPLGYPTLSTLLCAASVSADGIEVRYAEFAEPGHWDGVTPR